VYVQSTFTLIVFGAVGLSLIISLVLLVTSRPSSGSIYDEIGRGGLVRDGDPIGPAGASISQEAADSPAAAAEREREIRQMLVARSQRLVSRGEPALDVDAEVARLMAPAAGAASDDPALVEEVRQLVIARNERRARQGLEALDVQAEIARTLAELQP
jgi:hypothetical protein